MVKKQLWDAKTPALTPDISAGCSTRMATPGHDLDAEQTLFNMYLKEKRRAEKFLEQRDRERQNFTRFRARGIARGIAKRLKITHNPKVSK